MMQKTKKVTTQLKESSYVSPTLTVITLDSKDVLLDSPPTADVETTKFIEWNEFWN